ncbi:pentatricopeptide repeat-containing protein At1g63330-like [Macadamia integrifolia]|uniref:pentatricopeptide repeat-containing protein At1g63330-like n=1 Tax=Macadamia integrifolia TaxID=60698 RepID=UPI001C5298F2|nr:pentatricopeptide repeat-containing protein At1g63330-like [Macadamia integrifolia]XP_042477582.1 pentatricopeptide repeat-containing protein At1g63330-like [Macadamia integrifolia]
MDAKLPLFIISKKIFRWASVNRYISSYLCATQFQISTENDHNQPDNTEFQSKVGLLKNELCSDKLIRVLDSTNNLSAAVKIFKWASLQKRFRHTADTYSWIILKLGMAGNIREMDFFCNEMIKAKCSSAEEALVPVIDSFVRNHRLTEALRVLELMKLSNYKPSVITYNLKLGSLVKDGSDFQSVLFFYKEMVKSGIVPNVDTLNYLLEALFRANRITTAIDQFRRMSMKGCSPNSRTFEILITSLCARNRVDESVSILNEMLEQRCIGDENFYNTTIPIFCEVSRSDQGIRLLRMMRSSGLVPKSFVYGILVQCLCENLELDEAINLHEDMIETGLTPEADVYVDIVNGFCKAGEFCEARDFLDENSVSEIDPHNALLLGYCNASNFFAAYSYLQKMVERNIADSFSWYILIRGLCENGGVRKTFEVLSRMIISSYVPECAIYSALVVGQCKVKNYEAALQLFYWIRAKYWLLDNASYAELVEGLCHVTKLKEATEVLQYMSRSGCPLRASSLNVLIEAFCLTGKMDEAIGLRSLASSSGTVCSPLAYTTIMHWLCNTNNAKYVSVLFSQMLVEGCPLDVETYHVLLNAMSMQNRTNDCALLFGKMVACGLEPNSKALSELLIFMAHHSQLHTITHAIENLVCKDEVLSPTIYNVVINGLLNEGHKHEACRFLDRMLDSGWVPDAVTHGLLIGTIGKEEVDGGADVHDNFIMQDRVGNILAEGLEKT